MPKGVDKLPPGVEINGNKLRISFQLHGRRYKEPIACISKITKATIAHAASKRQLVLIEIAEGRFNYAEHFPESAKAKKLSGHGGPDTKRTVKEGLTSWLEVKRAKKATCTYTNYASKAKHVLANFSERRIVDISKSDLELFQAMLLKKGLSPKTVNDIFTIVRGVWADAFEDGILRSNPLERLKNIERDDDLEFADPFSREEMELIGKADPSRLPNVRMILFNCWVGLSLSEIIALGLDDVDLESGGIFVRRAKVGAEYKVPKEKSRNRFVELIDPAMELLKLIMEDARTSEEIEISVTQRDNVTVRKENVRLLFRNCTSGEPWNGRTLSIWFTAHLKRAGVRHRGANQCRHTFASQVLSSYVPLEWLARQLGHSDTTMVKKHYGRWIPGNTKSMAGKVSQMMGFRAD
ncbi:TPA: tyrosine-type recombinase/integrase [Pseudomonas aeruginosa]|nr:tyrosine-type recombinase/integrase [Pseudomonas aeruginosa]HEJ2774331.1 tyrosine-type recombinase/integrase [Pseudomonas aeruginosa]